MESSYEPIIPGLPDDIALSCLAKISHGHHGCLETVSKRWRDVLQSTEYSTYKAKQGWSGDWVFLLTEKSQEQWIAYDPDADRWHPIPLIPRKEEYDSSGGYGCVCVGNKFLVIGGSYTIGTDGKSSNEVFQFDTFTKEWSEVASMRTPRAFFGCCVMSGKVYVFGGFDMLTLNTLDLAEVYDPLTNKWEELPRMNNPLMNCTSLSQNGNLYAFTDSNGRNYSELRPYVTEIFDSSKHVWKTEQMNWPCSMFGRSEIQVREDGQLYVDVHFDGEANVVKKMDNGGEWQVVAKLPSMVGAPDGYENRGVFENGFVALGNELYVMGGLSYRRGDKNLKGEINSFNSDRCWIWDGKWRETRPICRPSCGSVKGFAALKEKKMSTTS